ncbi:glycosyltransferase family 2 protein, partial [Candidatus Amoebophilus asiaticus]|nr:glycosyltransferase family 2 protein [Candidatus Amoebophilus asiaticus]
LAESDFIVYMNDDMYVCPEWDEHLYSEISKLKDNAFLLSSTMIEPKATNNSCVIVSDFGNDIDSFQEDKLLAEFENLIKDDWYGSTWPPIVLHKDYWEKIGGFSEEFSPGMYSDPDLSMKMWQAGCRIFKGIGKSKVYHFQAKSTGKVKKNDGRKQFLLKWSLLPSTFYKCYLKMGEDYREPLPEPNVRSIDFRIRRFKAKLLSSLWN